jgi:glycogen operon protein
LYPEGHPVTLNRLLVGANKTWHGIKLGQPDWSPWSHSIAFEADHRNQKFCMHLILNAYWEPLEFELPQAGKRGAGP